MASRSARQPLHACWPTMVTLRVTRGLQLIAIRIGNRRCPVPRGRFEQAGKRSATGAAVAIRASRQAVISYQSRPMTRSAQPGSRCSGPLVMDVAGVDEVDSTSRAISRASSAWATACAVGQHLVVGVEGREVQGTSGRVCHHHSLSFFTSSGLSLWPGINSVVISNQTCVSCLRYSSVSRTVPRWPVHRRYKMPR